MQYLLNKAKAKVEPQVVTLEEKTRFPHIDQRHQEQEGDDHWKINSTIRYLRDKVHAKDARTTREIAKESMKRHVIS
jgi:hypothetical protein